MKTRDKLDISLFVIQLIVALKSLFGKEEKKEDDK